MFRDNPLAKWLARLGGAIGRKNSDDSLAPPDPVVDATSAANLRLQAAQEENRRLVLALLAIRHSAGNQLALLSALLERQARASGDPNVRQALRTAQLRVHAVANAMRADIPGDWSELVSSKSLVERAVQGLLELATDAGVEIAVDVQDFQLQRDDAFSYMLIINELAVNSLKHAFPNAMGGVIRIRFAHQSSDGGGTIVLVVEDNGVGRSWDAVRAGLGATVIGSAAQGLGATLSEEYCRAEGERRGLRTTISKPDPRSA